MLYLDFLRVASPFIVIAFFTALALNYFENKPIGLNIGTIALAWLFSVVFLANGVILTSAGVTLYLLLAIGAASKLKYEYMGIKLLAKDFTYIFFQGVKTIFRDHKFQITFLGVIFLGSLGISIAILAYTAVLPTNNLFYRVGLVIISTTLLILSNGPNARRRRFTTIGLSDNLRHFSTFIVSLFNMVESREHAVFVDIAPDPLPLPPFSSDAQTAVRSPAELPDIVLVQHESTFDPRIFGLPIDQDVQTLLSPTEGVGGRLHVDVFGGGSWQTEFAVHTGLSSRSFGANGQYVCHLLEGRLHHSLALHLRTLGYRTLLVTSGLGTFMNARRFYKSIGFDECVFVDEIGAPFDYKRWRRGYFDDQLYAVAFDRWRRHAPASQPVMLVINTFMNHVPHTRRFTGRSDDAARVFAANALAGRGPDEYIEYYARLAASARYHTEFRSAVAELHRPVLFAQYGDHQPHLCRGLAGSLLPANSRAIYETFYAIDSLNWPIDRSASPAGSVLDAVFLSTVVLRVGQIPLDSIFAARASLIEECSKDYFGAISNRKHRFHRTLVEQGLVMTGQG